MQCFYKVAMIGIIACFLGACDKKKGKDSNIPSNAYASGEANVVSLGVNDSLKYDKQTITVKQGKMVKLTLTHHGKMAKSNMGHNFVLLKKGIDIQAFTSKAVAAKETEYIPPSMKDAVIAHTKLLGGGESDTITFKSPAPGTYIFLCTFPGHHIMMRGEFVVQ